MIIQYVLNHFHVHLKIYDGINIWNYNEISDFMKKQDLF